ncbi:ATPase inhibitor ASCRUDRAFT_9708 [Ascoidea rubescens DSM 1968]|uniref:ATPase inhibitor, mitochondrial n=1 Tax=Ascoidea rubescens DSM 1968 TaxID=1344418 RepID=A0A1D2VBF8_9ASCO|nr:hypothetical protein ASCRUDRAFT_9708 [Ascoidea rubescens DSM 1968]ODV58935.1 hypothetical protein ASCRUDRAFT_9708 [Ascoidea rubescens DSM 1968]
MVLTLFTRRAMVSSPKSISAVRFYSEGSTGSFRGEGASDSFTKREKAKEDYYVKQHEIEKLAALRNELKKLHKEKDELEEKIFDAKDK